MAALLPPSLYFQMPPYKAFLLSYALLGLLLLLSSMALLFGSLCSWKLPTFCLVVGQMLLGFGLAEFHHPAMWLFPFSHAIVQFHYQDYLREYVFPPGASAAILGGAALAFAALCLWAADRADLDRIGGDIL